MKWVQRVSTGVAFKCSEQCDELKERKKLRIMEETAAPQIDTRDNKTGTIVFIRQVSFNACSKQTQR
jgi:hypothetical protein